MPLYRAAVAPFKTTCLLVGGDTKSGHSDKVYKYTPEGDWQEMTHMKLTKPKKDAVAMKVPSSMFH